MNPGQVAVTVIVIYLALLLALGLFSSRFFRGTAADYFLASRGIGSFLLLLTLFGTTMTAFALIGSTGEAYASGIGVYGKMVSWSGLIHSFCFFLLGIKLWSFGARYGYVTQIQFFRDRFESDGLGLFLFPLLVGLVIPYLLIGIIGGGTTITAITGGAFPDVFPAAKGGIPMWLGAGVICIVVLVYVFFGGVRGTTWANAFQTGVFIVLGLITFTLIADKLGGMEAASESVARYNPAHLQLSITDETRAVAATQQAAFEAGTAPIKPKPREAIPPLAFLTYMFIPLSVGMFPHLFQHWLTARSASSFKLPVIVHPLLMALVWVPCVLIGVWATSAMIDGVALLPQNEVVRPNQVLGKMVKEIGSPVLGGLITAGILAAIMSSLDSQFLCISSIFSNDIVAHYFGHDRISDQARVAYGRIFVILIVALTYAIALAVPAKNVFTLGVWCFSGFAALSPLAFAALYWRGTTRLGAYACVLTVAVVGGYLFYLSNYGAPGHFLFGWSNYADPAHADRNVDFLFLGMMPVATMIACSTLALVLVSLVTPRPSAATLAKFFGNPKHAG